MFYVYRFVKNLISYAKGMNTIVIVLRESNWVLYAIVHFIAIPWILAFTIIEIMDPFSYLAYNITLFINIALIVLLMPKALKRAIRKINNDR
ncbi:MAG: hypothetical protein BWX92_02976 [Deltaproteobacteria bacterium ADurb.Bin135]|nr:MAG: hypothetical protein BWX92_02976 [Deltaproteobacteria bacterium ADurb.Bin135]